MNSNISKIKLLKRKRKSYRETMHLLFSNEFLLETGLTSPDKRVQITTYLIGKAMESTYKVNMYIFSRKQLAKKFKCSMMTVSRAINALKYHDKYVIVKGSVIRLNTKRDDIYE